VGLDTAALQDKGNADDVGSDCVRCINLVDIAAVLFRQSSAEDHYRYRIAIDDDTPDEPSEDGLACGW
jgi:hypothetical protein